MEIFYAVAGVGITTLVGATALVIRSDTRRNRVWAGQWVARLERERQEDHAAAIAQHEAESKAGAR